MWFALGAMSLLSNVFLAAAAVCAMGSIANWYGTTPAFAVAHTKRSPRRLEESLT